MTEFRPKVPAQQSDSEPQIKSSNGNIRWFSAQLPDEYRCLLTGVACAGNTIIVVDNENKNIKRFLIDGKLKDSLLLTDPCGICSLPKNYVVVTEPDQYQITFCSADGTLSVSSASKTPKKYESIAALEDGRLVVGCCEIGSSSVDIIDNLGSVLKSIQTNREGGKLFRNPAAITCLTSGEILISDAGHGHLICISPDGETEFTYDAKGRPSGICVDAQGGIYMAQYDTHTVFRLSADGTKESVIVSHGFEIKSPLALAVNMDHLILTEEMPSNRVLLLKLAPVPDRQATGLSLTNVRVWLHQSPRSTDVTKDRQADTQS